MPLQTQAAQCIQDSLERTWPSIDGFGSDERPKIKLRRDQSTSIVRGLDRLICAEARLDDEKASSISTYIIDHMANRPSYPGFLEMAQIATYINSCE